MRSLHFVELVAHGLGSESEFNLLPTHDCCELRKQVHRDNIVLLVKKACTRGAG